MSLNCISMEIESSFNQHAENDPAFLSQASDPAPRPRRKVSCNSMGPSTWTKVDLLYSSIFCVIRY